MKLNYDVDYIPPSRKRSPIGALVEEFITSGKPVAEVEVEPGKVDSIYQLLYRHCSYRRVAKVSRNGNRIFLFRRGD